MTYCTCPACGKQFRRQPNHVYKVSWNNNTRYPCSYACMNEMLRKKKKSMAKQSGTSMTCGTKDLDEEFIRR